MRLLPQASQTYFLWEAELSAFGSEGGIGINVYTYDIPLFRVLNVGYLSGFYA